MAVSPYVAVDEIAFMMHAAGVRNGEAVINSILQTGHVAVRTSRNFADPAGGAVLVLLTHDECKDIKIERGSAMTVDYDQFCSAFSDVDPDSERRFAEVPRRVLTPAMMIPPAGRTVPRIPAPPPRVAPARFFAADSSKEQVAAASAKEGSRDDPASAARTSRSSVAEKE